MQDNNLANRINYLLEAKKIRKNLLAKRIKQVESSMYNYLNGNTIPTADFLQVILELTGGNGHWLLTGEGEIYLNSVEKGEIELSEATHIYIADSSNVNNGIMSGSQVVTLGDCPERLAAALVEVGYLKQRVEDLQTIVNLLKSK